MLLLCTRSTLIENKTNIGGDTMNQTIVFDQVGFSELKSEELMNTQGGSFLVNLIKATVIDSVVKATTGKSCSELLSSVVAYMWNNTATIDQQYYDTFHRG